MKEMNKALDSKMFTEENAEDRIAVELEERQELGWVCACDSVCGIAN